MQRLTSHGLQLIGNALDIIIYPVEKGENIWNLQFTLEDKLHREVDLVNEASLKNPFFIKEVNETKFKIYG